MEEQESPPVRILLVDGWALFRQAVGGALDGESLAQLSKLTQREREVLALLADESDKNAIARALAISPQTGGLTCRTSWRSWVSIRDWRQLPSHASSRSSRNSAGSR